MLLETMMDRGLGLIIVGAKSLSIFCTFKKSAQNHNEKKRPAKIETKKKETRKSPFFYFYVICSRVCHL
jgi:hypothetical protein